MLIMLDFKNRLLKCFSSTVKRFFRDKPVDEPRFTYITSLGKKTGGPDPESFGTVYRDETAQKEYLVKSIYASKGGVDHFAVFSIREIVSRPSDETRFDEATFKASVKLKSPAPDVENDMVTFFKTDCEKSGEVFLDRRKRENTVGGTLQSFRPAQNLG